MTDKRYLGDGVYFDYDGFNVQLTTENGISVTNDIFLEPEVTESLLKALVNIYGRRKLIGIIRGAPERMNDEEKL